MSSINNLKQELNNIGEVDSVSILTIIDNNSIDVNLETCWGLSFYFEVNNEKNKSLLMDCSGSLYDFSQNVSKLNLREKLSKLDAIHLSHWHYDHAGNLSYILSMISKKTPIYVPIGNRRVVVEIKKQGFNIVELLKPFKICQGIFTTGTLKNGIPEHSLVLNIKKKGLLIILGCAHPGVISIIEHSKVISGISKIYGVIGGFHISNISETERIIKYLKKQDLELISPCHCTGDNAKKLIEKEFKKEFIKNGSGLKIYI